MKELRNIIIFLGPQGSGKGTQAALLAKRLRLPAISTGALYREEVAKSTRLGQLARRYIMRGLLAPDEVTSALVFWRLGERDARRGAVLDGYPRTLGQLEAFSHIAEVKKVIAVHIPDRAALKRMAGRRVCSRCEENFHLQFRPPKKFGVCDRCGGRLIRRPDDNPAAVKKRLAVYHKNTEPVLALYEKMGLLAEIDGTKSVAEVARRVWRALRPKNSK
ncbi:nucleoside monophosphate kinase [Patescibacteria group bacterium]|nr:MAG: nucleoside monophosphate kinase [Patescibacteria group bacterium]